MMQVNKVSLITGASTGIGRSIALSLGKRGDTVIVSDIDQQRGNAVAKLIQESGGEAEFMYADVSDEDDVTALHSTIREKYQRLDYAINNAGIEGEQNPTADCTTENWQRTIATNLTGVYYCMKNQLKLMQAQNYGSIVNIASVAGKVGFAGLPAYCASKGGVIQLTKAAALEYASQKIRVNAICPGVIHTEMVDRVTHNDPDVLKQFAMLQPMERCGTAQEVADCALWLCSDQSSFVTGDALNVDGGFLAR